MLVNSTILFHEVDYAEARELDHTVLEGYLDGLRDVGWHGDPRQARFGEVANSAVRPFAVPPLPGLMLGILLDESRHTWVERGVGLPIIEIADSMAELRRYPLLDWEREARELLDALF